MARESCGIAHDKRMRLKSSNLTHLYAIVKKQEREPKRNRWTVLERARKEKGGRSQSSTPLDGDGWIFMSWVRGFGRRSWVDRNSQVYRCYLFIFEHFTRKQREEKEQLIYAMINVF